MWLKEFYHLILRNKCLPKNVGNAVKSSGKHQKLVWIQKNVQTFVQPIRQSRRFPKLLLNMFLPIHNKHIPNCKTQPMEDSNRHRNGFWLVLRVLLPRHFAHLDCQWRAQAEVQLEVVEGALCHARVQHPLFLLIRIVGFRLGWKKNEFFLFNFNLFL